MNKTTPFAKAAMMLLVAVLTSFMAVSTSFAAAGSSTKGSCGPSDKPESVLWEFNMATQTLTISGEGDMADFESPSDAPWYSWCNDITSVVMADGVTHVSDHAFSPEYWQLNSVTMPSTVLSIGDYAFNGVPVKSIQQTKTANAARKKEEAADEPVASFLPDNLQTIGIHALSGTLMTSLTIPAYVNSIGEGSLSYNSYLTTLTCLGTMIVPWLDGDVLEGSPVTAIYVPDAAIDDYKNAECWQQYVSLLKPISEQVDEPGDEPGGDEPTEPTTVTIGKAQYTADLPLTAQYKYALSQQVYSANEINHAKGKIWSIAFLTENGDLTRNLTVYLTHTDQSSLSSYSWQPVTEADCVFSGEVTFTSRQWNTIYFDKPFEYDGKSNIVVTVDDNTGVSGNWGALTNYIFYGDGNHAIARDNNKDIDPLDATSIENASRKNTYDYKSHIKLTFTDYPTPANLAVTDIGDKSANVQCSLRGEATAWNLRYRKVAKEGEEEQRYVAVSDLDTRSYTIEDLDPATKYEVQVQAVFGEDNLSAWSDPLVFVTNCCPVEEQAEIIYAVNSNYSNWFGYAIQFVDITNEENPIEVAYVNPVDYTFTGGTLTLCCGHKYKVNWIYDEEHSNVNGSFSLALFFEPGDKFFSMARGEAPEKTDELTTFVMDCTPYCTQMPQILNESGTTYNSATITFLSQTKTGQVVYSTEADFDPEKATPEDMDFEEVPQSEVPWDQPNASITLKDLQPLTAYYVRVRSVCTAEPIGVSRWSDPVMVTTGSLFDAPTQVIAEPVNSSTEKLSWSSRGNEKSHNLYYRNLAVGNPVDPSVIQTFGGGNGTGFHNGSWGDGIWSSYGDRPFSNTIFVSDVPGGSSFRFKAGNGKSGAGQTKILYGKTKKAKNKNARKTMESLDMKCLNDADRAARKKKYELQIWALEEQIKLAKEQLDQGTITQEQYDKEVAESTQKITEYRENLEMLNALPTDAQKLETMKALEASLASEGLSQEERQSKLAELNELRAITNNAEDPNNDGFAISSSKEKESNQSRRLSAADDDDTYIFFIRHDDPNGVLLVKDLTITPPEQVGEWTCIPNLTGTEYMLTGLDPNTAYEVMVEPVYDDGTTGTQSPITVFTTLGTETDPIESEFSVSEGKKVQFAHGNLRFSGDIYEGTWSVAKQQYDVLGDANVDRHGAVSSTYPADYKDLFCWSTANNHYGVSTYYYYDDEEAAPYFKGDFADWGENSALIADLGAGWSTLSKDEWNYLLNERENAAQLKSFSTITIDEENKVKGLVILPDEWNAPDGVLLGEEMTVEQWATIEQTGAVFLPVTGHLWVWKDEQGNNQASVNGLDVIGNYWTSTPSSEETGLYACALNFNTEVEPGAEIERRLGCAVRLVKEVKLADKTALNEAIAEATGYYDGIKTDYADIAATLKETIDAAQAVADNRKATQEEVDAAKQALDEALAKAKADVEIASSVATVKTVKSSGVRYNLSGQRVGKAYKGIVIVDGAKTIRK
jgi:hypothetical protein